MQTLIWGGAALTLIGLVGIVRSIFQVNRARRAGLDDAALRAELQKIVALNLGALGVSALGLMAVVAGIFLS